MTVCERLYKAAEPVWQACLNHPFVTGIGDGSLDIEKFRHFMLQDYLYLYDYAKVFAHGVTKAKDPDLMRAFAKNVNNILDGEMSIHRSYMARLGITEQQVRTARPALDNASYTSYMLAVAQSGGVAEITAAILACSWSYALIGQKLAKIPGAIDHPFYGEWIQGYASEGYAAENDVLMQRMNTLAADLSEETMADLTEIFINCSRYELGFWDMSWEMRQ